MTNSFVSEAVLLVSERWRDEGGCTEVSFGAIDVVKGARANPKLDIAELERMGVRASRIVQVLTGAVAVARSDTSL